MIFPPYLLRLSVALLLLAFASTAAAATHFSSPLPHAPHTSGQWEMPHELASAAFLIVPAVKFIRSSGGLYPALQGISAISAAATWRAWATYGVGPKEGEALLLQMPQLDEQLTSLSASQPPSWNPEEVSKGLDLSALEMLTRIQEEGPESEKLFLHDVRENNQALQSHLNAYKEKMLSLNLGSHHGMGQIVGALEFMHEHLSRTQAGLEHRQEVYRSGTQGLWEQLVDQALLQVRISLLQDPPS